MAIFGFLTLTRSTLSLYTGFKTLKPLLLQAWQEQFLVSHTQRKSLFNLPSVDRISTLQILKKYHNKERLLLLREISGAFQTKVQRASWDESTDVLCRWCQAAPDTHHRLSTCAAFSDTREPFQSLVTELIDENSHLVDLPVVFCEPDLHYIRSVHTAMPEATIPPEVIRSLRIRHGSQPFSCYTDGSCQAPACVMSRYSAYAIIADLYVNDQERMDQARLYASTGVIPLTLQLVGAARLTGAQNIHRAENLAVIKCFEAIPEAIIYTDSAVTMSLFEQCQQAVSEADLLSPGEFDLAQRLYQCISPFSTLKKIKAHRNISESLVYLINTMRLEI